MPSIILNEEILAKAMEFRPGPYWEMPSVGDSIFMTEDSTGDPFFEFFGERWFFRKMDGSCVDINAAPAPKTPAVRGGRGKKKKRLKNEAFRNT